MRSLVSGGSDTSMKNSDGETALDLIESGDESETIRIMIIEGA